MAFNPYAPSLFGSGLFGRGLYSASRVKPTVDFSASADVSFEALGRFVVRPAAGLKVDFSANTTITFGGSSILAPKVVGFKPVADIYFDGKCSAYMGPYWTGDGELPGSGWVNDGNQESPWIIENSFNQPWVGNLATDDIRRNAGKCCTWSKENA